MTTESQEKPQKKRTHRKLRIIMVVIAVLVSIRIALPYTAEWTLNTRVLNDLGDYQGHIDDVDLLLWAGSYRLKNLEINKKAGDQFKPFFTLERAEISVSWRSLWHGIFSVDLVVHKPQINFEDANSAEDRQSGDNGDWQTLIDQTVPFTINTVKIYDGRLKFFNRDSDPKVEIGAENIDVYAQNLTNIENREGQRVASVNVTALLFGSAEAVLSAEFDPFAYDDFMLAAKVDHFQLKDINDVAKAYAKIDFASGSGNLLLEMTAENGQLNGYMKPFLEDVEILDWEQDIERDGDNLLEFLWEGLVDLVESVFTNQRTDQLATEITIEGSLDQQEVDTWRAVWGVFKNAFVDALNERFNHLTPLTEAES